MNLIKLIVSWILFHDKDQNSATSASGGKCLSLRYFIQLSILNTKLTPAKHKTHLRNINPTQTKKIEEYEQPQLVYDAKLTLIIKPDKDIKKKEKYDKPIYLMNRKALMNYLQRKKKNSTSWPSGFILRT